MIRQNFTLLQIQSSDIMNDTQMTMFVFKPVPNDKILAWSKLIAFADNMLNVALMTISLFDRIENTVGKGENAGYQHFLLFPQCFPKPSSLVSFKVGMVS